MPRSHYACFLASTLCLSGCHTAYDTGSFGHDLRILRCVEDLEVLRDGNSMIAVSATCQGRVFTSTAGGLSGRSYGWFNQDALESGGASNAFSTLGGESRMWFGPEAGRFAVFFEPGAEQTVENLRISPDLNTKPFKLIEKTGTSITCGSDMQIRNANGYVFKLEATRAINLLSRKEIETELGICLSASVTTVAFSADSTIENTGPGQWTKEEGLLAIWDLGCMIPSPKTRVIIPLKEETDSVTPYFTPLTADRIQIRRSVAYYKADAQYLNKIGIPPRLCKGVLGSYSPELNRLNIVTFTFNTDPLYVNSVWGHTDPYAGDVINIFNGEVNPPLDRNWPFYEFESSSSARELNVGETMSHRHTTYHFQGEPAELNPVAERVLGVSLTEIPVF